MAKSELVDTTDEYGTVDGVETYVRNKDFTASSDLRAEDIKDKLKAASEWIDSETRRAWRTRRVTDREYNVTVSHQQKRWYERGRRRTTSGLGRSQLLEPVDPWAFTNLRYRDIQTVTKVEVLLPRSTEDITGNQGRDDGDWHFEGPMGKLYIDVGEFSAGPTRGGGIIPKPKVRVSFDYGKTGGPPEDINDAAERLVAADIINTDAYGAVIGNGPENVPDMNTGAQELFSGAMRIIKKYRAAGGGIL